LYWTLARREIQLKVQLKLGEMNANLLSHHNSMVQIISSALGSSPDKGGASEYKDLSEGHSSLESAVAAINGAMRIG
jgi:hypothetical protein